MQCGYHAAGLCRSCTLLDRPYADQLAGKERHARQVLGDPAGLTWEPPLTSPPAGFRNKAKMAVAGTVDAPTLGILDEHGAGVDLRACALHAPELAAALPALADVVTRARLTPYDVPRRSGELKHVLVTRSADGELMIRFVLRSTEALPRLRKHLPALQAALPSARVVTANLLPDHKAVLEGEREIVLTDEDTLRMPVNGLVLHLRPQSFFQTNTDVAAALYRTAVAWVADADPRTVWDLYCGVGGFALHLAAPGRTVTGVETSAEAVASARQTAAEHGLPGLTFVADDATAFATRPGAPDAPHLVVVNPPRRGLGPALAGWLEASGVDRVVYSSCHAGSLARDLAVMPSLRPRRAQVLDMFPQTAHYELLVLLERV